MTKTAFVSVGERVTLTLWVGALWTVGYIVAPALFANLADRSVAGNLAGQLFHIVNYIGLICGAVLLVSVYRRFALQWRFWVLLAMLILIVLSEFVIQPIMQELKVGGLTPGSPSASRFGMLHGASSLMYLVVSIAGLSLVAFGLEGREHNEKTE